MMIKKKLIANEILTKNEISTTNEINVFDKNFQKNKNRHDRLNDKRLKNFYQFVDDNQQQRIQIKELVFFDANIKRVNKFIDCQIDNQMISNKIDIKR